MVRPPLPVPHDMHAVRQGHPLATLHRRYPAHGAAEVGSCQLGNRVPQVASSSRSRRCTRAAKRLLAACYLEEDYFDLIDLDMFGSDTTAIGPALDAARFGGLLYLTSTDGFSSSGKRPQRALAAYGAFTRAHPSANEQGLRMLLGAVVREAAARGLRVRPVFSLYSPHGPVFRAMVRVTRGRDESLDDYGFVGYSHVNGSARTVSFKCAPRLRSSAVYA